MDRRFELALIAVSLVSIGSVASAANLQVLKGEVLLSHGGGYHAVQESAKVLVGDMIVSRPDSSAKIMFPDGCVIYLGMGMVFTVEPQSPCASGGSRPVETGASRVNPEGALSTDDGGWGAGTETLAVSEEPQTNVMPYLLGAAAIGGIAVAASALGGGGDNGPPISP